MSAVLLGKANQFRKGMSMKAVLLALMALTISIPADAAGSHSKRGYVKKDGTYVGPSHATNPNRSKADNYSSKGNMNPYTGKEGAKDPNAPAKKSKSK